MTKQDAMRGLMQIAVSLEGLTATEDVGAIASLERNDLDGVNNAVLAHGGKFAYWSTLEVHAAKAEQDAKDALDALEADILSESDDASTVTKAKARMKTDPRWKKLQAAWREAQHQLAMIRVGRKTVEEHKDALREAGQNMRAEMERLLQVRTYGGAPAAEQAERAMERFVRDKNANKGRT